MISISLQVSGKEAFILFLFFLLLLYSVVTFLKSWNKNYRDINHLPFYTMCEDKNSIAPGDTFKKKVNYCFFSGVLSWEDGGSLDLGGMGLSRTDSRMSRVVMVRSGENQICSVRFFQFVFQSLGIIIL